MFDGESIKELLRDGKSMNEFLRMAGDDPGLRAILLKRLEGRVKRMLAERRSEHDVRQRLAEESS